jgi:Uma2 family endonuclease
MSTSERSALLEEITEPDLLLDVASLPTEDDLPCDDGVPMETARHRDEMVLLIQSLSMYWSDQRRYYVSGNMFLHYDPLQRRKVRGPDFFLVLDVENRERKSWVVWQEGMRFPDLIIELLSDSTRKVDLEDKKELYERVFRTAEYYVYDPVGQEFFGYRLSDLHYVLQLPDEEQKIFSKVTGLYLIVKDGWLRWMAPEGMVLPTPLEAAMEEKAKATAAVEQAEQAEQRAEQAEQRAEQAEQRAEQERQRAEQERQRAEQSEWLLEEYRRRFGNLE